MVSEERKKKILKELYDGVVNYDEDKVVEWANIALDEGVDPLLAALHGLADGMQEVGELYTNKEYFVPELMMCSDALYAGLDILKPAIKVSGRKTGTKGSIILGVVEGDIHDIGKNLVKVMLDVAGWTIYDLGKDVPIDKFVEEQVRTGTEVVGLSALMTTSMLAMPVIINKLKAENPNVRIIVGGAPLNRDIADKYGADGYAPNAVSAVDEVVRLSQQLEQAGGSN